jgi:hypothetical protein
MATRRKFGGKPTGSSLRKEQPDYDKERYPKHNICLISVPIGKLSNLEANGKALWSAAKDKFNAGAFYKSFGEVPWAVNQAVFLVRLDSEDKPKTITLQRASFLMNGEFKWLLPTELTMLSTKYSVVKVAALKSN